ncbi:MAG: family 43 glycosylhydrolase, partial [Akkermansiaceae bacterium]|nr:family 43 glycosylhydrolase [Akkermansiaceae bacterium]
APAGYLFVTFNGEGTPLAEQIHFALSKDGRAWDALNGAHPVLVSDVGAKGVRDPYLIRRHDSKGFHLIATDLSVHLINHDWNRAVKAGSRSIVIWDSPDLVNWSKPRLVKVAPDDAGCTWAPEAVYDRETSDYLVFWASTTARDGFAKQWIWAARTNDFASFGDPFVYIEKPTTIIDTTIIHDGRAYYRFTKDEKFKAITMETAGKLSGPWADMPDFNLARMTGYEGPECYLVEPATGNKPAVWCLILDHYAKGRGYQPYLTRDLASGHFEPAEGFRFPFKLRHGSVLPLTAAEYRRLAGAKFDKPAAPEPPRPILDGFTADPSIRVFGDTYYVYPTSDKDEWLTTDFSVWSSKDLVTWRKEGMILDVTRDLKWANIRAWAPDCIERDGTYYFYFSADGRIGVATAKSPTGSFRDALGKPLLDRKADPRITSNTIDPYPFIDDDGQVWLYWGNSGGEVNAVKLKPDMVTPDGPPVEFVIKGRSSGEVIDFREGIVVFKRGGKYYFMWSVDDARSDNYRVAYGTSDSPTGPVAVPESATVLRKSGLAKGTGHHSVVNVPGTDRWYAVYHRHAIPGGSGYKRETCLTRMEFNPDGSIRPMDPMSAPFAPGDRGEPVTRR